MSTMRTVKVLLTSADPSAIDMMRLSVAGIERKIDQRLEFISARNGEEGLKKAWREGPDVVVADEIASRAGAFAMARDLRGAQEPFQGVIVILLDRPHDQWLAKWSGADAWFVKPVDPFALADRVLELLEKRSPGPGRDAAATGTRPPAVAVDASMREGM
jgi:two-component system alkaline phosphatase synthesis response regulator PhoP